MRWGQCCSIDTRENPVPGAPARRGGKEVTRIPPDQTGKPWVAPKLLNDSISWTKDLPGHQQILLRIHKTLWLHDSGLVFFVCLFFPFKQRENLWFLLPWESLKRFGCAWGKLKKETITEVESKVKETPYLPRFQSELGLAPQKGCLHRLSTTTRIQLPWFLLSMWPSLQRWTYRKNGPGRLRGTHCQHHVKSTCHKRFLLEHGMCLSQLRKGV